MKRLDWFIARRYLSSRKKGRFLSFITWIALGGITVGVTALNVVLGVMNGMQEELRDKILGSTPHVMVLQHGESLRMSDWRVVSGSVRDMPGVEAAAPFILTKVAILRTEEYVQTADLYGVSLEGTPEDAVTEMEEEIRRGIHSLEPTPSGLPPVVVGGRLAERMGIFRGDTLLVFSLENVRTDPLGSLRPTVRQFEVTATFMTGMYEYDLNNMYAPLEVVQGMLGIRDRDQVSGLGVRITDPWEATAVGQEIRARLGFPYYVESWITTNQSLFAALQLEKLAMGIILFLIVIVAAFNIVSTLIMVVVDRTSEIGILKSMGMTDRGILRVFLLQGFSIGVLGTVLGTGLGLFFSWILHRFEIIQIPPDVYFIDRLPISVQPSDVLLIVVGSLIISLLATIYPAWQASRLQPVEAIKHE
ncbi:MAG: ABC transporter permease [Gemmatimonadales bacterium]|nr:MAG: ABC transporter permease [Gemmatimonadales bacterium]